MEVQDIASNVASWLDNSTIKKLYVLGLLPSLASISKHASFWHSRVETLSGVRISFCSGVDWKQTYQILLRELSSMSSPRSSPNFWNSEDNALVSLLLLKMNYKPQDQAMCDAAGYGSVKILRFLLDEGSVDPQTVAVIWCRTSRQKMCHQTVMMLLEDKRVSCCGNILYSACINKEEEKSRDCAEIVKFLLTQIPIPGHDLLYGCSNPHTARMLIADKRIDPSSDDNMPLEQAIRNHYVEVVKVLLECPSVAQNISPRIREVARESRNEEIIKLIC
jgi:hypothetical protein